MAKLMASWAEQSFRLVAKGGYLDRLTEIYIPPEPSRRAFSQEEYQELRAAFDSDDAALLNCILGFEKFPFNDPYISFLRLKPEEIQKSPKTLQRICQHLRKLGLEKVVEGLTEPKQFNRQMGAMFSHWLHHKYRFEGDDNTFSDAQEKVMFLDGSGEKLRQFANQIGCGIQKQPDFVAKVNKRFVIGEAKFIGSEGGNQNRAFDDAIKLASSSFKKAVSVAILDGIIWIPDSGQMARKLNNFSGNALSALLLDDFLKKV
jgi:hypothetical protein